MNILEAISDIENELREGEDLPKDLWLFFSRWTPIVNVDLIIKNEFDQFLLTWRDDNFGNLGWHIPGGVVRYRETWTDRILAVAENELGVKNLKFNPIPLSVYEAFVPPKTRGHFISIPFDCFLSKDSHIKDGKWFDRCPDDLIECQEMYRPLLCRSSN